MPEGALNPSQVATLGLYSQGTISSTEAKAGLGCDRRGLIELIARHGLALPRVDRTRAEQMARDAFQALAPRETPKRGENRSIVSRDGVASE